MPYTEDIEYLEEVVEKGGSADEHYGLTKDKASDLLELNESIGFYMERYDKAGSNIFHLSPELLEMFRHTSADEIPFSMLKMPFDTIYIRFGEQSGIYAPNGKAEMDGAYVYWAGDSLALLVTPVTPNLEGIKQVDSLQRTINDIDYRETWLGVDGASMTVGDTFNERFINFYEREGEFKYYQGRKSIQKLDFVSESARQKSYSEAVESWEPEPDDLLWKDVDKEIISIVINALCYFSYTDSDIQYEYPPGAPDRLVKQEADVASEKQRKRAANKLSALGYRKVHICGARLEPSGRSTNTGTHATHWRRGHWRNQACGEGRVERKLVWIKPTIVGDDAKNIVKHVYEP